MRAPSKTIGRAKALRRALTPPEAMLWVRLRKQGEGPTFRCQHPVGPYILDFYCAPARLAVEVDGVGHLHGNQLERDERRDAWLVAKGVEVVRIPAVDVFQSPDDVADSVWRTAMARLS